MLSSLTLNNSLSVFITSCARARERSELVCQDQLLRSALRRDGHYCDYFIILILEVAYTAFNALGAAQRRSARASDANGQECLCGGGYSGNWGLSLRERKEAARRCTCRSDSGRYRHDMIPFNFM